MRIKKRPDSPFWQIQIGRKARFSSGTEDYAAAEELAKAEQQRLWRLEKLGDRGAVPFLEAAQRWLDSTAKEKSRDRWIVEWLCKRLDRTDTVSDVADVDALEQLRNHGIEDGWGYATCDRMMGTVSAILHACVRWSMLDRVPAIPMYRPEADEARWLTPVELDRLCWYMPMHQAFAARVAVHTLLRMRAMLQLTRDRVNFEQRRAWVMRRQQKGKRQAFGLPLNDEAARALRGAILLSPPASPWIFTFKGAPLDDCNTLAFQTAVKKAKVEPFNWHGFRHTGASWAVQNGVTLPELMLLGDWKDYRSVLRYAHLAPSNAASAADKVAQWAHTQVSGAESRTSRKAR